MIFTRIRCLFTGHVPAQVRDAHSRPSVKLQGFKGSFHTHVQQEWCERCGTAYLILPAK